MDFISIKKIILFKLLKNNNFVNSKCFVSSCFNEINNAIEHENRIKLKLPFPENLVKILYNEFSYLKTKWKRLNGGRCKSKFLKSLESNSIVVKIAKNQLEIKSETEFLQSHDQVKDNASENTPELLNLQINTNLTNNQKKRIKKNVKSKMFEAFSYLNGIGLAIEYIKIIPANKNKEIKLILEGKNK